MQELNTHAFTTHIQYDMPQTRIPWGREFHPRMSTDNYTYSTMQGRNSTWPAFTRTDIPWCREFSMTCIHKDTVHNAGNSISYALITTYTFHDAVICTCPAFTHSGTDILWWWMFQARHSLNYRLLLSQQHMPWCKNSTTNTTQHPTSENHSLDTKGALNYQRLPEVCYDSVQIA